MAKLKIINAPIRIWLQFGDLDGPTEYSECDGVTWCDEKIHDTDVLYVRAGAKTERAIAEALAARSEK